MPDDPDILVPLTSARTEFEGQAIVASLEADGIPAKVFATSANMLQWEGGYTDPIKVMVRRRDVERAAAALNANRRASIDIDWNEIDIGPPEDLVDTLKVCAACGYDRSPFVAADPCPNCGDTNPPVERAVTTTRSKGPLGWRPKVRRIGFILLGAAMVAAFLIPRTHEPALIAGLILVFAVFMMVLGGNDRPAPRARRR